MEEGDQYRATKFWNQLFSFLVLPLLYAYYLAADEWTMGRLNRLGDHAVKGK